MKFFSCWRPVPRRFLGAGAWGAGEQPLSYPADQRPVGGRVALVASEGQIAWMGETVERNG